jgi:hypothetical protein
VNGVQTAVYRVRETLLERESRRCGLLATVALTLAALLLLAGLPLAAFGVYAVTIHDTKGDVREVLAAMLVLVLCFAPLLLGAVALALGIRWLRRGSRLRELRTLAFGRELVSSAELAARTRRGEGEILLLLSTAERHGAAWRSS